MGRHVVFITEISKKMHWISSLNRRICHARRRGGERVLGDHRREGILAAVARRRGALEGSFGTAADAAAVELGQLRERRRRGRFGETDLEKC